MAIFVPARKDTGRNKPDFLRDINWGHPLSDGLIASMDYLSLNESVTGDQAALYSTANISDQGLNITGVWGEAASTADRLEIDNAGIVSAIDNDEWTVFFKVRLDDLTSNCILAGMGAPQDGSLCFGPNLKNTGELKFATNDGAWLEILLASSITRNTADFISIAIRYDGTNMRPVINGSVGSDVAFASASIPAAGGTLFQIGSGQRSSASYSYYSEDHTQEYFRFYNRALSDEEIVSLQDAPYQILKQGHKYWLMPEAVTSTFEPA